MSFSNSKTHEVEKLDSVSAIIPALIDRIKWYGCEKGKILFKIKYYILEY